MPDKLNIAIMKESDLPAVAELERICFSDPWSENLLREELEQSYSLFLTAFMGDEVAGYIGAQHLGDCAYICNVAVSPAFRRQHIGYALMDAQIGLARLAGMNEVTLEVRTSNEAARALYEKIGFVHLGTRPGFYSNPKEDAEIYSFYL